MTPKSKKLWDQSKVFEVHVQVFLICHLTTNPGLLEFARGLKCGSLMTPEAAATTTTKIIN